MGILAALLLLLVSSMFIDGNDRSLAIAVGLAAIGLVLGGVGMWRLYRGR